MRRFSSILSAVPLVLGLASCALDAEPADDTEPGAQAQLLDAAVSATDAGTPADAAAPFTLTSSVIKPGVRIDDKYRCQGKSPALSWTPGPAGTQSYAIIFQDAVNNFYHWTIFDIPATERGLPEDVQAGASLSAPQGAKQAPNWRRTPGYGGPCATAAEANRKDRPYVFTLYALDVATLPGITAQSSAANVLRAIEAHDLASTKLNIISYGL